MLYYHTPWDKSSTRANYQSMDIITKKRGHDLCPVSEARGTETRSSGLRAFWGERGLRCLRRDLPIPGRPDFSFWKYKVTVFLDGYFWHECPRCFRLPRQNLASSRAKNDGSRRRDWSLNRCLPSLGSFVVRIREGELKRLNRVLEKIQKRIDNQKPRKLESLNEQWKTKM